MYKILLLVKSKLEGRVIIKTDQLINLLSCFRITANKCAIVKNHRKYLYISVGHIIHKKQKRRFIFKNIFVTIYHSKS